MKTPIRSGISGLLLLATFWGCGGSDKGDTTVGSRLRLILTDQSQMATVAFRKPAKSARRLTGELEVVVKERDADRIKMEVISLNFRSVEDDLYAVTTVSGGTITVSRFENIEADVALSVNGTAETMFIASMGGDNKSVLLDREPPALSGVILRNDVIDPEVRGPTGYTILIFATVDGQPVPPR